MAPVTAAKGAVRVVARGGGKSTKKGKGKAPPTSSGRGDPNRGPQRTLWLPNVDAPPWLDGSMPGDAGFDPLSLGKPAEYVQFDVDPQDQNRAVNKAGEPVGRLEVVDNTPDGSLQPYTEVFDINRFRECELIHGRWAMLGILGAFVAELSTGTDWVNAGKVELEQPSYLGFNLPWGMPTLVVVETVAMGLVEVLRNRETDLEKRCYPGGPFDPLNLVDGSDDDRAFRLKTAEIKHARLAMVAALGAAVQAAYTGTGSLLAQLRALG